MLGIASSLSYSCFKIKKYSLVKNLYTALGVGTAFLVGAAYISAEVMWSYSLFFFFIMIMSLISDLRDYEGDKKSNIGTLPVSIGYENVRKILFVLLGLFSVQSIFSYKLFAFLPFTFSMMYFLYKNRPSKAHSFGGLSFIFLTFWLLIY
ncbi:MAG: UbiA family prenyltransferase [Candidatus Aenigmatarchaeota archaeon]